MSVVDISLASQRWGPATGGYLEAVFRDWNSVVKAYLNTDAAMGLLTPAGTYTGAELI